jgi:hypothetical protein
MILAAMTASSEAERRQRAEPQVSRRVDASPLVTMPQNQVVSN